MAKEHIDTPQDALSALADGQLRGEAFALAVERVAQQPEAQGDDERRQLDARDQQPVEQAKQRCGTDAAQDGQRRGQAQIGRELGHDNAAQGHHHAARQVDTGRQNNQGLANGDHADHGDLLQDQREVGRRQKSIALGGEDNAGDQQGNERPERANRR